MTTERALPPRAREIRSKVEELFDEAAQAGGEKMKVQWRGGKDEFPFVIRMPVDLLSYNPATHRIRAQRTLDPDRDRILDEEPWGQVAQEYLDNLLKADPGNPDKIDPAFLALKDDLETFGQQEPGLITVHGVLVNGNTRCAALRDLGEKYIRVGVLPPSTTWEDVNDVELSLQLRKERKRDYSYINFLIAIEEQLANGRRPEDIAREFRIKTKTLERHRWVHGAIADAIERSRTTDGASLRLVDFERHQGSLEELHRAYVKTAESNADMADILKESRLAMIILGKSKTDLRLAQPDFHETYLLPKLPASLKPSIEASKPIQVPGIPDLAVPDATPGVKAAKALTDILLQAEATVQSPEESAPASATRAADTLKAATDSFDRALESAGRDVRLQKRKLAAPERLSDACDYIEQCTADLAEARATRAIDEPAFDDELVRLREVLRKLAMQASRTFNEPGEGTAWLLKTAQDLP